jgi:hypothetical protein
MLELFSTDGVRKREDRDITGAAGLRAFMTARSPSVFVRHALSNVRTMHIDENSAAVECMSSCTVMYSTALLICRRRSKVRKSLRATATVW